MIDPTGKFRSSSRRIITSPTAPLAPTTATLFTRLSPQCTGGHTSPVIAAAPGRPGHADSAKVLAPGESPAGRTQYHTVEAGEFPRSADGVEGWLGSVSDPGPLAAIPLK